MARGALDASALLALILGEPGGAAADAASDGGVVSAVNWSEVEQRLMDLGHDPHPQRVRLIAGGLTIHAFDLDDAHGTAVLRHPTRALGLSLADRACLALASRLGVPAYTADRRWAGLDLGIEIVVIR